jgi:hypothetical protein
MAEKLFASSPSSGNELGLGNWATGKEFYFWACGRAVKCRLWGGTICLILNKAQRKVDFTCALNGGKSIGSGAQHL